MKQDQDFNKQYNETFANYLPLEKEKYAQRLSHNPSMDIPFDKKDLKQDYYRQSLILHENNEFLTKFGWKVAQLQREEQDLILQCCSCLQSQLICSVDFFTNTIEPSEDQPVETPSVKCLWIEASINRTGQSNICNLSDKSSSFSRIFQIYHQRLLPKLISFIERYIKWNQIIKNGKSHQQIVNAFQEEVIQKINEFIGNQVKHNEA